MNGLTRVSQPIRALVSSYREIATPPARPECFWEQGVYSDNSLALDRMTYSVFEGRSKRRPVIVTSGSADIGDD